MLTTLLWWQCHIANQALVYHRTYHVYLKNLFFIPPPPPSLHLFDFCKKSFNIKFLFMLFFQLASIKVVMQCCTHTCSWCIIHTCVPTNCIQQLLCPLSLPHKKLQELIKSHAVTLKTKLKRTIPREFPAWLLVTILNATLIALQR